MPELVYIGVDPGANGGVAALHPAWPDGVFFKTLPPEERARFNLLNYLSKHCCMHEGGRVVIERISPGFCGTGKTQMAKLYGSYTALRMGLVAVGLGDFIAPTSQTWHAALRISPRKKTESREAWKRRLKQIAEQYYPQLHITNATGDALLLAQYCKMKFGAT